MYFFLRQRAVHQAWGSSSSKTKAANTICEAKLSPSASLATNGPVYGGVEPDPSPPLAGREVDAARGSRCDGAWVNTGCSRERRRDIWEGGGPWQVMVSRLTPHAWDVQLCTLCCGSGSCGSHSFNYLDQNKQQKCFDFVKLGDTCQRLAGLEQAARHSRLRGDGVPGPWPGESIRGHPRLCGRQRSPCRGARGAGGPPALGPAPTAGDGGAFEREMRASYVLFAERN